MVAQRWPYSRIAWPSAAAPTTARTSTAATSAEAPRTAEAGAVVGAAGRPGEDVEVGGAQAGEEGAGVVVDGGGVSGEPLVELQHVAGVRPVKRA
jgi:hypothetical protein